MRAVTTLSARSFFAECARLLRSVRAVVRFLICAQNKRGLALRRSIRAKGWSWHDPRLHPGHRQGVRRHADWGENLWRWSDVTEWAERMGPVGRDRRGAPRPGARADAQQRAAAPG